VVEHVAKNNSNLAHINTSRQIATVTTAYTPILMTMDAGPSSQPWPVISGNNPGLLDPSQRTRLMRSPDSVLTFASFDPHTAAAHESQETLEDRSNTIKQDLYNSKRIVIETTSTGDQFWRFVPRARRDEGIEHEGQWPRLVELCGCVDLCIVSMPPCIPHNIAL